MARNICDAVVSANTWAWERVERRKKVCWRTGLRSVPRRSVCDVEEFGCWWNEGMRVRVFGWCGARLGKKEKEEDEEKRNEFL